MRTRYRPSKSSFRVFSGDSRILEPYRPIGEITFNEPDSDAEGEGQGGDSGGGTRDANGGGDRGNEGSGTTEADNSGW